MKISIILIIVVLFSVIGESAFAGNVNNRQHVPPKAHAKIMRHLVKRHSIANEKRNAHQGYVKDYTNNVGSLTIGDFQNSKNIREVFIYAEDIVNYCKNCSSR
jgi:hypothetical protein